MEHVTLSVKDIRRLFQDERKNERYVVDKTGCKMLEIVGATFIADEETIFGAVNREYVKRELEWYNSLSLNVNDIPGGPPREWARCADSNGIINSNYGWLIYSRDNCHQYENVLRELTQNPESRRAVMIYTRPSMWREYNENNRSDFVCTNAVQVFVRDGKIVYLVQMRSNDAWAGYRNDRAWHEHVHNALSRDLSLEKGQMIWHAGSLHLYERNFYLVDAFTKTGRCDFTKSEWDSLTGR